MPKSLIFVLVIFLIIVYVYTFIKWRKRRKLHDKSDIDAFKNRYVNNHEREKYIDNPDETEPDQRIDYIDKEDFYKVIRDEAKKNKNNNEPERKFTLKF